MISEAIDKISGMSVPVEFTIDDRKYSSKPLSPIKEPVPASLNVSTLTAMKDYYDSNPDHLDLDSIVFHIVSYDRVQICGPLFGQFEQRKCFVEALFKGDPYPYNNFIDPESFIIKLQAMFAQDDVTAKLLSIVGNIKDEKVATVGDDGISQQVTARVGIARVENISLPNPITLTPYRTFLDSDQPSSRFIFRMRSGAAEIPATCALFEADGGRWKLDAIDNIKAWLKSNINNDISVLA